jgi:hypothetical protein
MRRTAASMSAISKGEGKSLPRLDDKKRFAASVSIKPRRMSNRASSGETFKRSACAATVGSSAFLRIQRLGRSLGI